MKVKTLKRLISVILSLAMVLSVFTGVIATAEEADVYEPLNITIHPGIDETRLNFSWHSEALSENASVRIKAEGSDEWTVFTGTSAKVAISESGHQEGYHDTGVKNCGHTCSAVCGHDVCTASQCYHGSYTPPYYNRVTVTGLEFGTEYTYQLSNGTLWSKEYTTKTAETDPSEDGFQYLVFGDSQTSTKYYGDYMKNALELATKRFSNVDFLMNLGDNVHENNNDNYSWYFQSQDIFTKYPIAVVMGNHEQNLNNGSISTLPAMTYANPPAADSRYDYWFRYGDVLFITFNSGPQKTSMFDDLDKLIADAIKAHPDAKWKVLQTHQGFYSNNGGGRDWRRNFVPIIDKYDIDVVFNGHHHLYTRTKSLDYPDNPVSCGHTSTKPEWDCETCSGKVAVDTSDTSVEYVDPEGITYIHLDSLTAQGHNVYSTSSGTLKNLTAYSQTVVPGQGAITLVSVTDETFKVETYWINNNGTARLSDSTPISYLDDDYIDELPYDSYTIRKTAVTKPVEVTFDGGTDRGILTRRINAGETVAKPENPVLKGKSFKYWTLDGETVFDFATTLSESVTLTAVYEDIPPITTDDLFIEALKRGDSEIVLEADITLTDKDLVTISTGTTITSAEGQRYTITLDGTTRLATASSSKVTFRGINITVASTIATMSSGYNSGGYIKLGSSSSKLYIYDCNIHCAATTLGASNAAIIRPAQNTVSYVYIENSKITANLANEKGALIGGKGATYRITDSSLKAKSGSWLSCDTPTIVFLGESTSVGWSSNSTPIYNFTNTTIKATRNAQNLIELSKIGSGTAVSNNNYKIYYAFEENAFSNGTAIEYTEPIADIDYETPIYVALRYSTTSYYSNVSTRYCGEYIEGVAVSTADAFIAALKNGESVITITSDITLLDLGEISIGNNTVIQSKTGEKFTITLDGSSRLTVAAGKTVTLKGINIIVAATANTLNSDTAYYYGYITVKSNAKLYVYDCSIKSESTNLGCSTASLIKIYRVSSNPGYVHIEDSTIVSPSAQNKGVALNGINHESSKPVFRIIDSTIKGNWIFYQVRFILEGTTVTSGYNNGTIYDFRNTEVKAARNPQNLIELSKIGSGTAATNANYKIYYALDKEAFSNGTAIEYTEPIADIDYETPIYVAIRYSTTTYYSTYNEKYCGEYVEGVAVDSADGFIKAIADKEPIITLTSDIVLLDKGEVVINSETVIKSKSDVQFAITLDGDSRLTVGDSQKVTFNNIKVFIAETANKITDEAATGNQAYYYGYITVNKNAKLYIYDSYIESKSTDLGSVQTAVIKIRRVDPTNAYVHLERSTVISPSGQNKGVALAAIRWTSGTKPTFRYIDSTIKGNYVFYQGYHILEGTTKLDGVAYSTANITVDLRNSGISAVKNQKGEIKLEKIGTGAAVTNETYKIYYSTDKDAFASGTATEYTGIITDVEADTPIYVAIGKSNTYEGVTDKFYGTTVEYKTAHKSGDLDGDGAVVATDLTVLRKYFMNKVECDLSIADANWDNKVNLKDLVYLKKLVAGLIK